MILGSGVAFWTIRPVTLYCPAERVAVGLGVPVLSVGEGAGELVAPGGRVAVLGVGGVMVIVPSNVDTPEGAIVAGVSEDAKGV